MTDFHLLPASLTCVEIRERPTGRWSALGILRGPAPRRWWRGDHFPLNTWIILLLGRKCELRRWDALVVGLVSVGLTFVSLVLGGEPQLGV